jgi:hypothetical protein
VDDPKATQGLYVKGVDILINQYKSIVRSFPDVGLGWGVGFSMLSFGGIFCPVTQ